MGDGFAWTHFIEGNNWDDSSDKELCVQVNEHREKRVHSKILSHGRNLQYGIGNDGFRLIVCIS